MKRDAIPRFLTVLVLFSALTAAMFWPLLPHMTSALPGPPEDNLQDFWNTWYAAAGHGRDFFFTRLIRFPEGVSLIYHSFAYPQLFAVWALSRAFGTSLPVLILLQNLTILASFPLAGGGAFYLCRYLGAGIVGAIAGGFIFAFNPWHVAQALHHAHVAGIEFLPPFVLCYLLALERKNYSWLAAATVFYVLSALSCWYFLFYGLYFLIFHGIFMLWRTARRGDRQAWWSLLAPLYCFIGMALLLSPLLVPMAISGFKSSAYNVGTNIYVADLLAYTAFPPGHLLAPLGAGLYAAFTGNAWEATVYLGLVNLALLAWALYRLKGPARQTLIYAVAGMILFLVLASGEALHVGGTVLPFHLPDVILSKLPFFANVRTPARAIVFVYLFLGVAVSLSVTALQTQRGPARIALGAAAILMLLDFAPLSLPVTPVSCAPELSALTQDREQGFGVLDLPTAYADQNFAMTQQACHGRPIASGIIARQLTPSLADRLDRKNIATQRRQLADAHIKYILLHLRHPDGPLLPEEAAEIPRYRQAYDLVRAGPDMLVLKVY